MKTKLVLIVALILTATMSLRAVMPKNYYATKAQEALENYDIEKGLEYALLEITDYDKNPEGYYMAAMAYYVTDSIDQAMDMIDKAILYSKKDKKTAVNAYLLKARIYRDEYDFPNAGKAYDNAVKADKKNIDARFERSNFNMILNRDKSLKDLKAILKIDPTCAQAYTEAAATYYAHDMLPEAMAEVNKALALDNDNENAYAYYGRALIRKAMNDSPDWIYDAMQAYKIVNDESSIYDLLKDVENDKEKQLLESLFDQTISDIPQARVLWGKLLFEWEDYDKAIQQFEEVKNEDIESEDLTYYIATSKAGVNDFSGALEVLNESLTVLPENIDFLSLKANICEKVGLYDDAVESYQSIIELDPDNIDRYMDLGNAYLTMGRPDLAIRPLTGAYVFNPDSYNVRTLLADAQKLAGNTDESKRIYKKMLDDWIEDFGDNEEENETFPNYVMIICYAGMGQMDKVREIRERDPNLDDFKIQIYILLNERDNLYKAIREEAESKGDEWWYEYYITNYIYRPFHTDPAFQSIFFERGLPVHFDEKTEHLQFNL